MPPATSENPKIYFHSNSNSIRGTVLRTTDLQVMLEAWQQLASAALDPVASTKLLIDNAQLAPLCFAAWIDQYARHPQLVGVAFARIIQIVSSADMYAAIQVSQPCG
jgi:hypothetical protein